jgi:hypothetical protein
VDYIHTITEWRSDNVWSVGYPSSMMLMIHVLPSDRMNVKNRQRISATSETDDVPPMIRWGSDRVRKIFAVGTWMYHVHTMPERGSKGRIESESILFSYFDGLHTNYDEWESNTLRNIHFCYFNGPRTCYDRVKVSRIFFFTTLMNHVLPSGPVIVAYGLTEYSAFVAPIDYVQATTERETL